MKPTSQPRGPLSIHIDHMVLEGLPLDRSQASVVERALRGELVRLVEADGLPARVVPPAHPNRSLKIEASDRPAELGRAIAQQVYVAMGGRR